MSERFIPALRFRRLAGLYDPLLAVVLREAAWKAEFVEQVGPRKGMSVLDLGCGTGTLTILLARAARDARVVGVDADLGIVERARRKAKEHGVDVELIVAMAGSLPFPDATFDRVVSSLVFHHLALDEKRAALDEVVRILRPGGELHIADWGRPHGVVMRAAFLPVQLLDGFETTSDNVRGALPSIVAAAGFADVRETRRRRTVFGTLSFIRARRVASPAENGSTFMPSSQPTANGVPPPGTPIPR